jgi:tetraacyldisaccharide 4'-kinase
MFKLIYPDFWQKNGLLSYLLIPFSKVYSLLSFFRWLFSKTRHFNGYVICIGNVTVGGTGKTQVVIWLAQILRQRNIEFVILTKGYGSQLKVPTLITQNHNAEDVGDEAKMLSSYGQVIASRKPQSAIKMINKLNPKIIILDDGMQNPNIYKNFNILTIDGLRGMGNERIIPAGPLRQKFSKGSLQADTIILMELKGNDELENRANSYDKPVFKADTISDNENLDTSKNYYAFSGIGNPERFFNTLKRSNLILAGSESFPDHHNYLDQELETLVMKAKKLNSILITTAKDYVKIPEKFKSSYIECFNSKLIIENENKLVSLINERISQKN